MAKTILSVDDSASIRQMVKLTLSGAGYDVIQANDGADDAHQGERQRHRAREREHRPEQPPGAGAEHEQAALEAEIAEAGDDHRANQTARARAGQQPAEPGGVEVQDIHREDRHERLVDRPDEDVRGECDDDGTDRPGHDHGCGARRP